jgi:hypothetical protein
MGAEPFTLEAYIKLTTLPTSTNTIPVITKGTDYQFYAGGGGLGNTAKGLTLRLGSTTIHSTLAITDSNWHYISVSFNSVTDTVRFMLDGQIQTLTTTAVGTANTDPVVLAGGAFDGLLDEVSITAGFLAAAELQPINPVPPGPFRITASDFSSPTVISLTFESREDLLYTVQKSNTLAPGSWTDVRTNVPGTPGASSTTINDLPRQVGTPKEFFRIQTAP